MNLDSAIQARFPHAAELRHRLHRIPELAFQEFQTADIIRAELDRLGIPHVDGVADAPTATISLIGDPAKPCIALRADIDALPIVEQTGLAYSSSHPGRMHACGHDGHTAALLATAAILQELQHELGVCVKLIFQPAEEEGGGADRLVRAGTLDGRIGPAVRAIFGFHGWPGLPVGCVASKPGALMAATDIFKATIIGKGCHGAFPHLGVDPIVPACESVVNLQQIVSRDIDPTEPAVVTVGIIHAGSASNVIPDQASFEGTARTISDPARAAVKEAIFRRIAGIASAAGCTARIDWLEGYPATVNDPGMTDYAARIARQALGPDRYFPAARPSMGGEDFAYYLQKVPGCFFLVGVEPHGSGGYPSLHNDHYDFTDAALPVAMRLYVELIRNFR
ncbi:MAG: M20 family metallopeptidase [Tepidisphaeraceae bacterium]